MYAEERQQAIAEWVTTHGRAAVTQLADRFAVTPETVRRDLDRLEDHGLVRRVHGGAVPATAITVLEADVHTREQERVEQKDQIAARALEFLPPAGGSVLVDAGTTTGRLLAALPRDRELTVVTNGVVNAARLAHHQQVRLELIGGRIRGTTQAAVGALAVEQVSGLRVDVAYLGTNGLTATFGASTPDGDEAAVKAAMVNAAHQVVVLADAAKLGREHLHRFADPDAIDLVVTDDGADPRRVGALQETGLTVVLA